MLATGASRASVSSMTGNTAGKSSPEDVHERLGAWCRDLREDLGHTQDDVARAAVAVGLKGWTRSTVSNVESGKRLLSLAEVLLFLRVFGRPLSECFSDDGGTVRALGVEVASTVAAWYLAGAPPPDPLPRAEGLPAAAIDAAHLDEVTRRVARSLQQSPDAVDVLARAMYEGRGLVAERERKLLLRGRTTSEQEQALRGHLTRGLVGELRVAFGMATSVMKREQDIEDSVDQYLRVLGTIGRQFAKLDHAKLDHAKREELS